MATQENNSGLYFIVGALVVIVALIGFIYVGNDADDLPDIDPAAGVNQAADNMEETSSELNVDIDDDGFSASSSQSEN